MTAIDAVRERLLGQSVSTRVYRLIAPQKATLPYVRVQLVDAPIEYHLRGPHGTTATWVQVDAVGAEAAGIVPVQAMADAIDAALSGQKFTAGSPATLAVTAVFRKGRREMFEAGELRLIKVMQDYVVWTTPA